MVQFSGSTILLLSDTRVSDASVPVLIGLPRLSRIEIDKARVSAKGYAELKAAFPKATILWSEPNRTAAEAVLRQGGTVAIRLTANKKDMTVEKATKLPVGYFWLTKVNLADNKGPLDKVLRHVTALTDPDFDRLEALDLSGTAVTDEDLSSLGRLSALTELSLGRTKVGDAALARIKPLTALRSLDLDGTPITGYGIRSLHALPKLTELHLGCPTFTDRFAKNLVGLKQLERLSLANSGIGDEGVKHLTQMSRLRELDLTGTRVSNAGIATLAKALPQCKIMPPAGARNAKQIGSGLGGI